MQLGKGSARFQPAPGGILPPGQAWHSWAPFGLSRHAAGGHGRMPLPTGWKPALPNGNPIGVAEYQLQPKLPAELKGKLPTAKQLSDAMKGEMGRIKDELQRS